MVPTGMPLRGPVSEETAGPDGSDPLAVGLVGPLGLCGTVTTAAYVAPPSGDPSCRPPVAACSPVAPVEVAGSGADPAPGAGRLVAGSEESPELAISLALRLPATLTGERLEAVDAPPNVVCGLQSVQLASSSSLRWLMPSSTPLGGQGRAGRLRYP